MITFSLVKYFKSILYFVSLLSRTPVFEVVKAFSNRHAIELIILEKTYHIFIRKYTVSKQMKTKNKTDTEENVRQILHFSSERIDA